MGSRTRTRTKATAPALVLVLVLVLGSSGCATFLRVEGPVEADVSVALAADAAGKPDYTYVGRGKDFVYKLGREFENQKIWVLVRSDAGAWKYTVFTDRDVTVRFPPKGSSGTGIGSVEAVLPEARPAPAAAKKPAPASSDAPPDLPEGPAPRKPSTSSEEPSATLTPD